MPKARTPSREDSLSRDRIVLAAIDLLDEGSEDGLTFRALAARLQTGAGAIYWHVSNKRELLVAATDAIVAQALAEVGTVSSPKKAIRKIALCLFDAIEAHPWVGAQLSRAPWEADTLQIFEQLGRQVAGLDVRAGTQFTAASALLAYILGVSVQNAAQSEYARRELGPAVGRDAYLGTVAARWKKLDAERFPFVRKIADRLPKHDDRSEYLAGIDFLLAGIAASSS